MSTFTEEDAMNDGKVREATEPDMVSVAKSQSPRIFQHFERVCESMDQEPRTILGNMLIRALNNEEFAQQILETDINMRALNADEITMEDIELVDKLAERFDLKPDGRKHPVEKIIDSRLEAVGGSPFDAVRDAGEDMMSKDDDVSELKAEINDLERKLDRVLNEKDRQEKEVVESSAGRESDTGSGGSSKSVDELFEDVESEDDSEVDEETDVGEEGTEEGVGREEEVGFDNDIDEYSGDADSFTISEDEESEGGNMVSEEDVVTESDDGVDNEEEEDEDMEITTNDDVKIADEDEEVEE